MYAYDPSPGEAEIGGSQELDGQPVWPTGKLQIQREMVSLRKAERDRAIENTILRQPVAPLCVQKDVPSHTPHGHTQRTLINTNQHYLTAYPEGSENSKSPMPYQGGLSGQGELGRQPSLGTYKEGQDLVTTKSVDV